MAGSAKTIFTNAIAISSRLPGAVRAGLTAAIAAVLATAATVTSTAITVGSLLSATIGARLTAAIAALLATTATAVTSTTAEATTMASTTLTAASAIAPAIAVASVRRRASRRGNNLELRQASHRQRTLEHPLNVLEQRPLIRRHE
jgi:hypothetical protein